MKQFNKTSALRKIKFQQNKNTYIKRLSISLSCLILLFVVILFTFARFETSSDEYTMINGQVKNVCEYELGHEWTFDYNGTSGSDGSIQSFNVPCNGVYKLETWGAQGGYSGGYGSYSIGYINYTKNINNYIVVGGQGQSNGDKTINLSNYAGYNGGGNSSNQYNNKIVGGGGGATHIAINSNLGVLTNYNNNRDFIVIVSGGGGGSTSENNVVSNGGAGGGYIGNAGTTNRVDSWCQEHGCTPGSGGTQTAGVGYFGAGAAAGDGAGGGGGYYGGGAGGPVSGGGGSGYIGNSNLTNKHMTCYNCTTSNDTNTKTISNTCHSTNPTADCAKEGNGYARITLVSTTDYVKVSCDNLIGKTWNFDYTGSEQELTIPCNGQYKLETWGAQGEGNSSLKCDDGSICSIGGYGGYAVGNVFLTTGNIYLQVGESGQLKKNEYNGGGYGSPGGGGATSVSTSNRGTLSAYQNYKSEILIVAGGGGGDDAIGRGGSGGGYIGGSSSWMRTDVTQDPAQLATGGTQTAGGTGYENGSFGQGGGFVTYAVDHSDLGGAGGGGYYGGGSGGRPGWSSGGGGSGYIGNSNLTNKKMVCYNCTTSNDTNTKTISNTCHNANPTVDCAKEGNGYAKITYLGE